MDSNSHSTTDVDELRPTRPKSHQKARNLLLFGLVISFFLQTVIIAFLTAVIFILGVIGLGFLGTARGTEINSIMTHLCLGMGAVAVSLLILIGLFLIVFDKWKVRPQWAAGTIVALEAAVIGLYFLSLRYS